METINGSATDNSIAHVVNDEEQKLINQIKTLLQEQKDLVCPMDDVYLLRFLRYRKHDVDRTVKTIVTCWKTRHRFPYMHDNLNPSCFKELYEKKFSTTLANRDKLGRQVVVWKFENWDAENVPLLEMFKSIFCMADTQSARQLTQLHGCVCILDLAGLGVAHVKACTPYTLKTMLGLIDGVPMKIKGIHFINHPTIFNAVYAVAKMFMKSKMKKRVQFHGYDYTSLHKFVDPGVLPKCYGGLLGDDEAEELDFLKKMLDNDQYYKDLLDVTKYGFETRT